VTTPGIFDKRTWDIGRSVPLCGVGIVTRCRGVARGLNVREPPSVGGWWRVLRDHRDVITWVSWTDAKLAVVNGVPTVELRPLEERLAEVHDALQRLQQRVAVECPGPHRYERLREDRPPFCPVCRVMDCGLPLREYATGAGSVRI
jgi:hypothetical protein